MQYVNLTENAKAFLAMEPALMGQVAGVYFYEHPVHGDESPMMMITREGKLKTSCWFEMPSYEEVIDSL